MAFVPGLPVSTAARRYVADHRALCAGPTRAPRGARTLRMTIATPLPASPPVEAPPEFAEPVLPLSGTQEFLAALAANADRLVVVKVFAPWCRSCKALEPKVRRLAREFDGVSFFSMDYEDEENKQVCFRLGVSSMPTFLFYHGAAGLVDKFACGPARADILRTKIQEIVDGECAFSPDESS